MVSEVLFSQEMFRETALLSTGQTSAVQIYIAWRKPLHWSHFCINWLLNQTVEHILSHYILLRGVPNLPKTDCAISIIWLRYIMPKKSTRCHRQSTALVSTWCQKQINHPSHVNWFWWNFAS